MSPVQGIHDWPLFIVAGLLLNLTPGVDMALVLRCSVGQGWRAGAAAALGVGAGCWVHTALAALGLGAVLAGSPLAFGLLRWAGAAYLVWLGWGLLRSRVGGAGGAGSVGGAGAADAADAADSAAAPATGEAGGASPVVSLRRVFVQGFLTNALNPKVAMFFLAFVPQFISADAPHKSAAFIAMGTVFVLNGTVVNLVLAGAAGLLRRCLAQRRGFGQRPVLQRAGLWLNRGVGALFVALGLRLALGDAPLR